MALRPAVIDGKMRIRVSPLGPALQLCKLPAVPTHGWSGVLIVDPMTGSTNAASACNWSTTRICFKETLARMRANDMALPFSAQPARPVAEPVIARSPAPPRTAPPPTKSAQKKLRREQEALERKEHQRRLQHFTETSVPATLHEPIDMPQQILKRYGDTDIVESVPQPQHPGALWQANRAQGPSHA